MKKQMKKKKLLKSMLSFAMSAALLLSSTVTYAQTGQTRETGVAVTAEADDDGFVINENGVLTGYEGTAAEIVIPNSVTSIGRSAFSGCSSLKKVTIPGSVTSIEDFAFSGCQSLTDIDVLSENNFYASMDGCVYTKDGTELLICPQGKTEVDIPEGVTSIGYRAFAYCSSLEKVTLSKSITSIGDMAFEYCSSLTDIEVSSENDVYVSVDGCVYTKDLTEIVVCPGGKTEVDIPGSVTSIRDYAFCYCTSLTEVMIPESVTSIGNDAFRECTSLTEVVIPESVTSIGSDAFFRTIWLSNKQKENPLVIVNHILIDGNTCSGAVEIPDGVTSIGRRAFWYCTLTEVTIPESVTSIGEMAFYGSKSLTEVTIPGSVTSMGIFAFGYCNGLEEVTVLEGATCIWDSAFCGCSNLEKVTIPNSVTSIGEMAFRECSSLEKVVIPEGVTSIGYEAFFRCSSLERVTIPESVTSIGGQAFFYCSNNLTFYGKAGSYAEEYAGQYHIPFCDFVIVTEQTDTAYIKGSPEGAVIKCSGASEVFVSVYVDGTSIEEENYTLEEEEGATVIRFTPEFLDTLEEGDHIFTLEYTENRKVETTMTITASAADPGDDDSGDDDSGDDDSGDNDSGDDDSGDDGSDDENQGDNDSIVIIGDVDGDGEITADDALDILKSKAGLIVLTDKAKKVADVDGDGEITSDDALDILKKKAGLLDKFKAEADE